MLPNLNYLKSRSNLPTNEVMLLETNCSFKVLRPQSKEISLSVTLYRLMRYISTFSFILSVVELLCCRIRYFLVSFTSNIFSLYFERPLDFELFLIFRTLFTRYFYCRVWYLDTKGRGLLKFSGRLSDFLRKDCLEDKIYAYDYLS